MVYCLLFSFVGDITLIVKLSFLVSFKLDTKAVVSKVGTLLQILQAVLLSKESGKTTVQLRLMLKEILDKPHSNDFGWSAFLSSLISNPLVFFLSQWIVLRYSLVVLLSFKIVSE